MDAPQIAACSELGIILNTSAEIPTLMGAAYHLDGLLLTEHDLAAGFFDLRSGWLGELFQKLTNDGKWVALVVPEPADHGERFVELAREHASHRRIRFFKTEAQSWAWLNTSLTGVRS